VFETDIGEDHDHSSSFAYISIPQYALRELWLSRRSKNWVPAEATIESSHRTVGGYKETIRVEVWYGFTVNDRHYAGHLIRDTCFYYSSLQRVMDRYSSGEEGACAIQSGESSGILSSIRHGLRNSGQSLWIRCGWIYGIARGAPPVSLRSR